MRDEGALCRKLVACTVALEAKRVLVRTTVGCVLATEAWLHFHVMFNRQGIFDAQHV